MANLCNRMSSRLAWLWNLALTQACVCTHTHTRTHTYTHVWCVICIHTHTQTINAIKYFFLKNYMRARKSFLGFISTWHLLLTSTSIRNWRQNATELCFLWGVRELHSPKGPLPVISSAFVFQNFWEFWRTVPMLSIINIFWNLLISDRLPHFIRNKVSKSQ